MFGGRKPDHTTVAITILVAALGILSWKLHEARTELSLQPPGVNPKALGHVLARPQILKHLGGARFALIVLFTPHDCSICLPELSDLNGIHAAVPAAAVVGIMSDADLAGIADARDQLQLHFPVVDDAGGAILRQLAPPTTPWRVLVDRSTGRIMWEAPPSFAPPASNSVAGLVAAIAGH